MAVDLLSVGLSDPAASALGPTRLDPIELFLTADIVVQAVMIGLILASIWVGTSIVSFSLRMGKLDRRSNDFEVDVWEAEGGA